jgi:hypothetical protein
VADDQLPFPPNHTYGKETYTSEHVNEVIKAQDMRGMQDKFNDIMESKYASHVREPLGQSYQRGYNWPKEKINDQSTHTFGVHTKGLMNAKEILYPKGNPADNDPKFHDMYKRTHGNFDPGEQKKREYDWNFNPGEHRFGFGEKKVLNGAAMAIHNERPEEHFPQTVIVKKTVEDQRAVASDLLGISKNLGQGQVPRGPDFVHGVKNVQEADTWNAARCIHGEPQERDLKPDHDLGKSTKPNCRNVVRREEDIHRSFGVPTIRKDIPYKEFRSVADFQVSAFEISDFWDLELRR